MSENSKSFISTHLSENVPKSTPNLSKPSFIKVKLGGQTYHVKMSDQEQNLRKENRQRAAHLHKETTRRRQTLEQRKHSHEQKEEEHRQKVLAARRAQLMMQTQRYLRSTSRRPIPPSSARNRSSMSPRPYTAMNYPSGTSSARDNREIDKVLKQIRSGSSIMPTAPSKPKITRIYNSGGQNAIQKHASDGIFQPVPPDFGGKQKKKGAHSRPVSAFDHFSSRDLERMSKSRQDHMKAATAHFEKSLMNVINSPTKIKPEPLPSEKDTFSNPDIKEDNLRYLKQQQINNNVFIRAKPLSTFASGDSPIIKPVNPVTPIRRLPTFQNLDQNNNPIEQSKDLKSSQENLNNTPPINYNTQNSNSDASSISEIGDGPKNSISKLEQNSDQIINNIPNNIDIQNEILVNNVEKIHQNSPTSPSRYERSVFKIKIPTPQNILNESVASATTDEEDFQEQKIDSKFKSNNIDKLASLVDDKQNLINFQQNYYGKIDNEEPESTKITVSPTSEIKTNSILRSKSARERAPMNDSIEIARNRVFSARSRQKKAVRWSNELQFNDGSKRPMPRTIGYMPTNLHQPKPPSGLAARKSWSRNTNSNNNYQINNKNDNDNVNSKIIYNNLKNQSKGKRIIQEAVERGYAQQHLARKQYQNEMVSRPGSGKAKNLKSTSFKPLVRPMQQQPQINTSTVLSPTNGSIYREKLTNPIGPNIDPRRTPTDQDIVQLWQTVRNVLNTSQKSNSQNFIPKPPQIASDNLVAVSNMRPRSGGSNLSVEEQQLINSLDRLNSRLYEIEGLSGRE